MTAQPPDPANPAARDWDTYRVGLTGGIASGKSAVAEMFAALGVPVIDTDLIAREIVQPGSPALQEILAAFGPQLLLPDGNLNRAGLRAIVFAEPERRKQLDAITHPRIGMAMETRCRQAGGPYQLLVVPLLVESGLDRRVDRVLVVDCPEQVQLSRLMTRDGETEVHAKRLLAAQLSRTARLARADDVIDNSSSLADTQQRVAVLDASYRKQAGMAAH